MAGIFLRVANAYLCDRNQQDTLTATLQFLNRTQEGRALIVVEGTKLGRSISVLHLTLYQSEISSSPPWTSPNSVKTVVGYITNGNMSLETGITLRTGWQESYPPLSIDFSALEKGKERNWKPFHVGMIDNVHMLRNLEWYTPSKPTVVPGIYDVWLRFANREAFQQTHIPFVADQGPAMLIELFRPKTRDAPVTPGGMGFDEKFWFPTLSFSIEMKKKLPPSGVTWLRMRAGTKMMKNGRNDCEILIFDVEGDLVALCNVVAMAMDVKRNMAGRRREKI